MNSQQRRVKDIIKLYSNNSILPSEDELCRGYLALFNCIVYDAEPNEELGLGNRLPEKEQNIKSIKHEYVEREIIRVYFPSGRIDEGTIDELLERNHKYKWTRSGINRVLRGGAERHKKFKFERVS